MTESISTSEMRRLQRLVAVIYRDCQMLLIGLVDFSVSPAFAPPNYSRDTQTRLDVAFSLPVLHRCPNSLRQPYHRDWDKAQPLLVPDRGAFDTCDRHCTVVNRVSRTCSSNLPLLFTLCLERV